MSDSRPRILVVDDSRVIRHAAARALAQEFDLTEAQDGEEAWQQLRSGGEFELMLCDLHMPRLDGFGLLQRMRGEQAGGLRQLPVIMVTGEEDTDAARAQALAQGATDMVSKPFDPLQLRARVRGYVEARREARRHAAEARALAERNRIDPVTQLGNRAFVIEQVERTRSLAVRHGSTFSLVCLQVEGATAELEPRIAGVFEARIRREDTVGRVGPARYALLLPSVGSPGARFLARRIRREILAWEAGLEVRAGVLTPVTPGEATAAAILAEAEAVLERARAEGATVLSAVEFAFDQEVAGPAEDKEHWPDLEQAVSMLARGERAAIEPHLQRLLGRLMPMLRLLSAAQREWLAQQLGLNRKNSGQ